MTSSIQITSLKDSRRKRTDKSGSTYADMAWIEGGEFEMGSNDHYPEEAPAHRVNVEGFWMDKYAVTNGQFTRFFEATGHITVAERAPDAADYPGAKPEMLV